MEDGRDRKMTALSFVPKLKKNYVYILVTYIQASEVRINDRELRLQTTLNPVYTNSQVRVVTLDRSRGANMGGWSDQVHAACTKTRAHIPG